MNTVDTTNVVPLHPVAGTTPQVCRVAPIVAKWVAQTDRECLQASAGFRHAAPALMGEMAAAEHGLREQLQCYASAHREHVGLGLQGFHPYVSRAAYWPMLLAAALLEAPVNKHAMAFLAMSDHETWAVAGFISVLNVMAASYFGRGLRQAGNRPCRDWFVLAFLAAAFLGAMTALAGMRVDYIAFTAGEDGMPLSSWALPGLVAMQALFLAVGMAISFAMVPADPRLGRVLADKERLRRSIDALLRLRTGLAARHDRLWLQAQQAMAEHRAHCQALISEYRDENLSARGTRHPVPGFLRRSLDAAVFAPVDLGPRVLNLVPTLEEVLQRVEREVEQQTPAPRQPQDAGPAAPDDEPLAGAVR